MLSQESSRFAVVFMFNFLLILCQHYAYTFFIELKRFKYVDNKYLPATRKCRKLQDPVLNTLHAQNFGKCSKPGSNPDLVTRTNLTLDSRGSSIYTRVYRWIFYLVYLFVKTILSVGVKYSLQYMHNNNKLIIEKTISGEKIY